MIIIELSIIY